MTWVGPLRGEALLALRCTVRDRTARLVLAIGTLALAWAAAAGRTPAVGIQHLALFGGTIAAVAAGPLLAPGPLLAAARLGAAPWVVPAVGRLLGVAGVVAVPLGVGAWLGSSGPGAAGWLWTAAALQAAATAAVVLWLGAACGASSAAGLGALLVWFGAAPPSAIHEVLARWQPLQRVLVTLWNVLPLPWRADRLHAAGSVEDLALFCAWTAVGAGGAAVAAARAARRGPAG